MGKSEQYTIISNKKIAKDVYQMRLQGSTHGLYAPGQFINIKIDGFFLRRPISVYTWDNTGLEIIYKILGKGTKRLAQYLPSEQLDILVGLGNGFSVQDMQNKQVVLVGGGVGVPPLYEVAGKLIEQDTVPTVVLGFKSKEDIFAKEALEGLGCTVYVATEDGQEGKKGFVTDILTDLNYNYYATCGPMPMLKAVYSLGVQKQAKGQLSFEERMGCGFGACMGCTCHTLVGPKRVCIDGPVFNSEEVIFE